jgi:hypothetical protein
MIMYTCVYIHPSGNCFYPPTSPCANTYLYIERERESRYIERVTIKRVYIYGESHYKESIHI